MARCSSSFAKSLAVAALILVPTPAVSQRPSDPARAEFEFGNYDVRIMGRPTLALVEEAYGSRVLEGMRNAGNRALEGMAPSEGQLRRASPGALVKSSALFRGAEVVRSERGYLAEGKPGQSSTSTVLAFIRRHGGVYGLDLRQVDGLEVLGESVSRHSGLSMVRLQQRVRGLPVFQSETRAVLDRSGRLVRTVGRLLPGIDETLVPDPRALMAPEEALRQALSSLGIDVSTSRLLPKASPTSPGALEIRSKDPRITRPIHAEKVYFPLAPGIAVPAWQVVTYLREHSAWLMVVDGRSGVLLYRKNLRSDASRRDARFSVYAAPDGHPLESPAPGAPNFLQPGSGTQFPSVPRSIVSMHAVRDPIASPNGWIPDHSSGTTGNNVDAFLSRGDTFGPDSGTLDDEGRAIGNPDATGRNRDFLGGAPRDFAFTPAPLGADPDAGDDPSMTPFQRGVVTNLFFLANWFHDRLYSLGFDEPAGNFQNHNFKPGGKRRDPVEALAQIFADVGSFDTAFSAWPPDGQRGQVALGLFASADPPRDSGLDAPIVLHELAHGLSGRLIGNATGLNWTAGLSLGEGWSDFYGLALVYDRPSDNPDAQYALGGYSCYLMNRGLVPVGSFTDNYLYGLRRFPYTTDNQINPLTFADLDQETIDLSGGIASAPFKWENFSAGEGHSAGEIWALALWEARSRIIATHGGDVTAGNQHMLEIVTDALKMTPIDPSILEARDALIEADCAADACAHEAELWAGFADRGLGHGAADSGPIAFGYGVRESFSLPHLDDDEVIVDDPLGNGNRFAEPGETIELAIRLVNPWRGAGRGASSVAATLTSETAGVSILAAASTYGSIPAGSSATGSPFTVALSPDLPCGGTARFNLEVSSSLGSHHADFAIRLGRPDGSGAPITFTRTIPGGLEIPDREFRGVGDTLEIPQDLEIADLDVRIDDLRHTFVGNLVISLRSPGGLFTNLIYRPGICTETFCSQAVNNADDFVGTRIDDASSRDLMTAGPDLAPFTGDWIPALNSTFFEGSDPIGQMSRYRSLGTAGTWRLRVTDPRAGDTGRLNSWSLIVTPTQFTCGP